MTWHLTFDAKEDMRAAIFDFAKENGLKILELNSVISVWRTCLKRSPLNISNDFFSAVK